MLIHEELQLTNKLRLLVCIWQDFVLRTISPRPVLARSEGRHILHDEKTQLITCLVEQRWLHFDLHLRVSVYCLLRQKMARGGDKINWDEMYSHAS